jgi:hypothetical protein
MIGIANSMTALLPDGSIVTNRYCDLYGLNVTENPNRYLRKK